MANIEIRMTKIGLRWFVDGTGPFSSEDHALEWLARKNEEQEADESDFFDRVKEGCPWYRKGDCMTTFQRCQFNNCAVMYMIKELDKWTKNAPMNGSGLSVPATPTTSVKR